MKYKGLGVLCLVAGTAFIGNTINDNHNKLEETQQCSAEFLRSVDSIKRAPAERFSCPLGEVTVDQLTISPSQARTCMSYSVRFNDIKSPGTTLNDKVCISLDSGTDPVAKQDPFLASPANG